MRRHGLSDLALARPITATMALLAVLLVGFVGLDRMPLSYLPLNQAPRIFVSIDITRTSPEILERDVIRPIEEQIAGIRDLNRIQVGSGSWGVRVNLDLAPGTDVDARKIELRERLDRVRPTLPEFVQRIEIGSYTNYDDPIMELQLSSGTDLSEDYNVIEERIVRKLERIRGVSRIELSGVSPPELEVAVDLEGAQQAGISSAELTSTVRDAQRGQTLGQLRDPFSQSNIRRPAVPGDPDELARLPVRRGANAAAVQTATVVLGSASGAPAASAMGSARFAELGEVAEISIHPQADRRARRLNGRSAVNVEVFATAGASIVDVSDDVRATVEELRFDPTLDGIELLVIADQGQVIVETLTDLRNAGIYGGLLGVVVLFGFLHRFSSTLAAAVCIPLSVLSAGAVLFFRGDELNCVVLLGLVLGVGMLIDNAVVIVEAITLHLRAGKTPWVAAGDGAREVGFATIASTASSVIVFLPLVINDPTDEMTAYLRPLGVTFAIALLASLFVSQTAVPLLMSRLLKSDSKPTRHRTIDGLSRAYGWLIARSVKTPRLTIVIGLLLAASAAYPFSRLNVNLGHADFKPNNLPIRLEMSGSHNMETIGKTVQTLEAALLKNRERLGIDSVSCAYSDHWGNCRVYPAVEFESEGDVERFQDRIQAVLPEQPGTKYRLGEREGHWRDNNDRRVVEFAIRGEDMGELMRLSEQVAEHLRQRLTKADPDDPKPGEYDTITTPFNEGAEELHVRLDSTRMRRFGLDAQVVAERVALAFQGLPLGTVTSSRGEVDLRLSVAEMGENDGGIEQLRDLRLPIADGQEIPLGSVAQLERVHRPWWIQRVDRQTEVRVSVRFFDESSDDNWEIVGKAMEDFHFPQGYSWGRGTMWRAEREAGNEMLINLGLCLLLVYAVMASLFESFLQPFGILLTCLLGCFGAFWALWATGTTLDTVAIIGFFILIGVVVNNGIMLVDKITQLRSEGIDMRDALRLAGQARLRPILMTMTTTVLGLLPMLIHHPTLAGIYYHAIAIVITGGLFTSTMITLFFLPATYTLLEGFSASARRAWSRATKPR